MKKHGYKIIFKDLKKLSSDNSDSDIYLINIKLENLDTRVESIINNISNKSWINQLDVINKVSYEARAKQTIKQLTENILKVTGDEISKELGEILISCSAKDVLEYDYKHKPIPLAELWHAKKTGNPSFDFHSESSKGFIVFGEGKYRNQTSSSPYGDAIKQVSKFIEDEKDKQDMSHVEKFVSAKATERFLNAGKAFAIAFSMNNTNHKLIFEKALKSEKVKDLLKYPEFYLIGVEI